MAIAAATAAFSEPTRPVCGMYATALLAAVSAVAYIPQTGRVGSLNVAVAAAIAMAETRRREWHPGG